MKTKLNLLAAGLFLAATSSALAGTVRYVDVNSASPTSPYTTWATAARVIQLAVNVAGSGDEIVVTNGTYASGGRVVYGSMTNRVAVTKPLTLRSVNGPQFTVIQGYQVPGTTNGDAAIRCVYLTNGASLFGFTLANGATRSAGDQNLEQSGGGLWCESASAVVSNCVLTSNSAGGWVGAAFGGTLYNCTLTGNSGWGACAGSTLYNCTLTGNSGDGAYGGTLYNCTLTGSSGWGANVSTLYNCTLTGNSGGGAYQSTLNHCTLTGNSGGGAYGGTLNDCTLSANSTGYYGGGAWGGTLNNCTLSGNYSAGYGGGAYEATLNNCTLSGNSTGGSGGGASYCTLYNCTLSGNSANGVNGSGGGASGSTLYNCILYYNTAGVGANYDSSSTLNYCCTTPQPTAGTNNLSLDPQLASASHLSAGSPCRGAGSAAFAAGTDIDGEAWGVPPSIGCDEYHAGAVTGALSVAVSAAYTNVAVGFPVGLTAMIEGRTSASMWDFGDGIVVSNRPYASHAWAAPGDYVVVLWAYNESLPAGVSGTVTVHVVAPPVHYVAADSANPLPPYTSWATAATNIQDAVDAATVPGAWVLVTNGTYASGERIVQGTITNRVAVDKPVVLRSINGPQFTVINGQGSVRCVYLGARASLSGFTLTNGLADNGGGGWCESDTGVISNCVLVANSASDGGGAYGGTLYNCTLAGNSGDGASSGTLYNCTLTDNSGVGASGATLYNCTLTGNSGGGVSGSTLYNCISYYNAAGVGSNYDSSSILNYCCTTPQPPTGTGNLSLDPQLASASHLSAGSPCRGAGSAAYATGTDIDGEAWGVPPSIGCDEYHMGAVTGLLSVAISAAYTNVAVGFAVGLTALIEGPTSASVWDFGDGIVVSNRPYASHAWTAPGDYALVLWAYNESQPGGVSATVTVHVVAQPVHYVAAGSANPLSPYTSWATAARNIQAAVDAFGAVPVPGSQVLVTNGTYASGGRAGSLVAVDRNLLTVRSVNGPQFTVINGSGAVRCVYLTNDTLLVGFTLTNGSAAGNGGGVYCESASAVLSNCVLSGNSGSAAYGGTLNYCTLTGNSGGGASGCTLYNCTLTGNSASGSGGGADNCTLYNCTLTNNSASAVVGPGAWFGGWGGGAINCTLYNCTLTGNSALGYTAGTGVGGGANSCTLYNCTLTGNSATVTSSGAYECTLNNCIVYYNSRDDLDSCTVNYCCTPPLWWSSGVGNITNAPLFVNQAGGNLRLQANSPCINAGNNAYVVGSTDLDGNPRIVGGTVDIGAYEFPAPEHLSVSIATTFTNVATGFSVGLTAEIDGRATASVWDFGDGIVVSNLVHASHAWATAGDYAVVLRAYNESLPGGMSATVTVHVVAQAVHYVTADSANPLLPYTSWATAATNIQDAVDAATVPGELVVVTNGTYATGGRAGNRVVVDKPLTVCSVKGPQFTVINGQGQVRCVSLASNAVLSGFILTNGAAGAADGGGASGGTLNNCALTGNSANYGGGASGGTLNNCTLTGNSAHEGGGGAHNCTLNNCTLSGNSAYFGGGADSWTLNNCIVYFNTDGWGAANWLSGCALNYCCTTPDPGGVGNITNAPLFVDQAGGNLRLQSNSPCINAGNNTYVTNSTDLDGRSRIVGGTVDMGAYEFQPGISGAFIAWLQQYGLPTDGSVDSIDSDGDGMNNWKEWICGTCPTNAQSALRLLSPSITSTNATVTWQSVAGVRYFLERSANLGLPFALLATNILGQAGTTSYVDTNASVAGPFFYRVMVPLPPGNAPTYGNNGNPWTISASGVTRIEAENYDIGGEGVAYHDNDSGNDGGQYRDDDVDIEAVSDTGGGYDVGWIGSGEWLTYTITVPVAGTYNVTLRVARQPSGDGSVRVLFDGVDATGALDVPSTGAWQTWTSIAKTGVSLSAGPHVMRIEMLSDGFNINWIELSP